MKKAIEVEKVSKRYKLYNNTKERLLDVLLKKKDYGKAFYALSDVDFVANRGEVIGFVGINGSGKSTLSNVIAGIVPETSGTVKVHGEVSIIAVSAGLKGDLSGRENIEMKLLMLGFTRKEIEALEQEIIDFSELGDFIDQPVKSYSSGMKSRLGFAISVNIDPDILIIDEALSVGDKAFAEKSLAKMKEFKERGKTMIFVSHSVGQMKRFCDKILWLEYGRVKEYGPVSEVMPKYEHFIREWKKLTEEERIMYRHNILNDEETLNETILLQYDEVEKEQNAQKDIVYVEDVANRIARVKEEKIYLYDSPRNSDSKRLVELEGNLFYTKRFARIGEELFYLLSTKESAVNGVVGWIDNRQITSQRFTGIDQDSKTAIITGTGSSYNMPWGSDRHFVIRNLVEHKDEVFEIDYTARVHNTAWYYGQLNGEFMWISNRHVREVQLCK